MAKKIEWTDQAKVDVRAMDRETALRLLHGLARFAFSEEGDVNRLLHPAAEGALSPYGNRRVAAPAGPW